MRKLMYVLVCILLVSMSVSADIIAFEAEDEKLATNIGAAWETGEDENALGGTYIVLPGEDSTNNTTTVTAENTTVYMLNVPAGTYTLYVKYRIRVADGADDSIFVSQDSFAETASMADFNGMDATDIDGNSTVDNYGWVQVHNSYGSTIRTYVQSAAGPAYFKVHPRETGLELDAFAFVPQDESVTSAQLDEAVLKSHIDPGAAINPMPANGRFDVDSELVNLISWSAPEAFEDLASVQGYDVYFGTVSEPNDPVNTPVYIDDALSMDVELTYNTTYYWRVDSHVTWTDATIGVVEGEVWQFTTLPDDKTPIVTADDTNVITSVEFLPASLSATVSDWGEGDIVDITWATDVAINEAMQMYDRSGKIADLDGIVEDPNLLVDWIGTDTRDYKVFANPMSLTLKGLPAATYNWKSYHHDADNQSGTFDVTVIDANGSAVFTDNVQTNGATAFVPFETTITTNGTDDVVLVFELQVDNSDFFVMNGFELTDGGASPLKIDFEPVLTETVGEEEVEFTNTMPGYQSYTAEHEVADTFIEKSFAAFGTNVSIIPEWSSEVPMPVDVVNDPKLSAQAATFSSDRPVAVTVTIKATDAAGQTGSASILVTIAADACAGAQLDSASWGGFSEFDFNEDCVVNVLDFAELSVAWMDDRLMTGQK